MQYSSRRWQAVPGGKRVAPAKLDQGAADGKQKLIFACIRYLYTWNKKGALKHNTPDSFPKEINFPNIIEF